MVATTIAAVGGDKRRDRIAVASWHVAGLIVGASILAMLASGLGGALPLPRIPLALALGSAAVIWGISSLLDRPLPVASSSAQVPLAWRYTMSPPQYAFSYGVGLGVGAATRVLSFSFYVFVGLVFLIGDIVAGLMAAQAYALVRSAPVVAASLVDRSAEEMISRTGRWRVVALRADAAILVFVGTTLILMTA